jgi:hypothetical protein
MIHVLTLSLTLALAGAPADLAPVPALEVPAPVQYADATLPGSLASPLFVALGDIGEMSSCHVVEDCDALPDISCSGNTCSARSRNCPYQRGYVKCDGVYTWCSQPCPQCTNGDFRMLPTGQCCNCYESGGELTYFQECIDEQWVTQFEECMPSFKCPICP